MTSQFVFLLIRTHINLFKQKKYCIISLKDHSDSNSFTDSGDMNCFKCDVSFIEC